jgi:ATP-dependent Clp protease, protease subunit
MSYQSEFEKYAVKHRGISSNTLHSYSNHMVTALTANVIEERPMNVAVMDVYKPFNDGPHYLFGLPHQR